ncbi:MAG: hypothetical protein IJV11_13575 [Muribaculaceae bacterium]|nr:hypothetical protein [Muribaculaceae bacterium]
MELSHAAALKSNGIEAKRRPRPLMGLEMIHEGTFFISTRSRGEILADNKMGPSGEKNEDHAGENYAKMHSMSAFFIELLHFWSAIEASVLDKLRDKIVDGLTHSERAGMNYLY